jgi:hypothetical protein
LVIANSYGDGIISNHNPLTGALLGGIQVYFNSPSMTADGTISQPSSDPGVVGWTPGGSSTTPSTVSFVWASSNAGSSFGSNVIPPTQGNGGGFIYAFVVGYSCDNTVGTLSGGYYARASTGPLVLGGSGTGSRPPIGTYNLWAFVKMGDGTFYSYVTTSIAVTSA